jgi:nitroreductase
MPKLPNVPDVLEELRNVRQARQYTPKPISDADLQQILTLAQWTGSGRNVQPWHFVVVTDKEQLRAISALRTPINWVADAPAGIAVVLDNHSQMIEAYDEGRVTERIMIAAKLLGLRAGIAWFGDEAQEASAKDILGVPAEKTARAIITIGYATTTKDPRPNPAQGGRKPLSEIVSYGKYGSDQRS